jgi:hypothetical protein
MVADTPLRETISLMYDPPVRGFGDLLDRGYGYAFAWVLIPLGLLAAVWLLIVAITKPLFRTGPSVTSSLGWVMAITLASMYVTPTLRGGNARYNLHILAGLMVAITWLLRRDAWHRVRDGIMGALVVMSLYPLSFIDGWEWSWGMTDDIASIFREPFAHHAYVAHPTFDKQGDLRVKELHAGDRVVFDQEILFIGALWNFDYSNVIRFIPSEPLPAFLEAVRAYDPKWVAIGNDKARAAFKRSHDWELVGKVSNFDDELIFRRSHR